MSLPVYLASETAATQKPRDEQQPSAPAVALCLTVAIGLLVERFVPFLKILLVAKSLAPSWDELPEAVAQLSGLPSVPPQRELFIATSIFDLIGPLLVFLILVVTILVPTITTNRLRGLTAFAPALVILEVDILLTLIAEGIVSTIQSEKDLIISSVLLTMLWIANAFTRSLPTSRSLTLY